MKKEEVEVKYIFLGDAGIHFITYLTGMITVLGFVSGGPTGIGLGIGGLIVGLGISLYEMITSP